jgi:hypothetical protein
VRRHLHGGHVGLPRDGDRLRPGGVEQYEADPRGHARPLHLRGGTGTTNPSVVARPTAQSNQSRWAKQVDVECEPWQKRIDAVTPQPTDAGSLQTWLSRTLPLVREQIAAVEAVKPPLKADEARKVRLFLDGLHKTVRTLTRYLAAIRANAPAKVRKALADAAAAGAATRAYAVSLGITQCGGYSSG